MRLLPPLSLLLIFSVGACQSEVIDPAAPQGILQPDMAPRPDMPPQPEDEPDPIPEPDPDPEPEPDPSPDPLPEPGPVSAILLQGKVLTPGGILEAGQVLVVDDTIVCVSLDCSAEPEAAEADFVDTGGIISPGLVDAHNHLPYNFLPEWETDQFFENRYQWADDPSYEEHISPYSDNRSSNSHFCPAARWAELRALFHGTTTIMGQSFERNCTQGWVRNADHSHDLQYDHMRTSIGSVRDINDADAQGYLEDFNLSSRPITRFAVHMGEGISGNHVNDEFASFVGRDPRANHHAGESLMVGGTSILIHSVAVTDDELQEVAAADAKIVWSPSSNMILYGQTADIGRILELGITASLSPDWTVSGEDNMLAELRYAWGFARFNRIDNLAEVELWEMATSKAAEVVGLDGFVGRLEPGQRADITVFRDKGGDPFNSIIESRSIDVRLVLINGEGYYGDSELQPLVARHDQCETVDVCGVSKFLCIKEPGQRDDWSDESMGDIRAQLVEILDGYGRADDLLELVDCFE